MKYLRIPPFPSLKHHTDQQVPQAFYYYPEDQIQVSGEHS